MHNFILIEDGGDRWGNLWTALSFLGSTIVSIFMAFVALRQYKLESRKYQVELNFNIESLRDHQLKVVSTSDTGERFYDYLELANYGDGYAKNIEIILNHNTKEETESIALLGPRSTSKLFRGICGIPSKYNKNDILKFEYSYTDGLGKIHSGNLSYIIGEDYLLVSN